MFENEHLFVRFRTLSLLRIHPNIMSKAQRILVVDDDADVVTSLRLLLKRHYHEVATETNVVNLHHRITTESFDLVLLDMNFKKGLNDGNEGLFWLNRVREYAPNTAVVMMTAYGEVNLAVEAMKRGANDFILKPWTNDQLVAVLQRAIEATKGKKRTASKGIGTALIGESDALLAALSTADKVAATNANVLVLGENGTGKDLLAARLHKKSDRAAKPLIKVDLGALSESLFESELFGHVRGAFTDAKADKPGRFEAAHGGTLFLDEIGNLSTALQAKLLTALQNRQVTRLGSHQPISVDVRLICATNQPLYEQVDAGTFRQDLLYRINTVEISMPPLRVRGQDILLLADHFLRTFAEEYSRSVTGFSPEARTELQRHPWPGNVRELRHSIERAVILSEQPIITADDLQLRASANSDVSGAFNTLNLMEMEQSLIKKAIEDAGGNISHAAKALGITRTALYRRMEKYGL